MYIIIIGLSVNYFLDLGLQDKENRLKKAGTESTILSLIHT